MASRSDAAVWTSLPLSMTANRSLGAVVDASMTVTAVCDPGSSSDEGT